MTRIRYWDNGVVRASKPMLVGSDMATVEIDARGGTFKVVTTEGKVLAQGEGKSYIQLQQLAKNALVGLGVNFSDELRDSKKRRAATATAEAVDEQSETSEQDAELNSDDAPAEETEEVVA